MILTHSFRPLVAPMTPIIRTDTQPSDLGVDFIGMEVLRANKCDIHTQQLEQGVSSESICDERPILSPLIFGEHRYPHPFLRVNVGTWKSATGKILSQLQYFPLTLDSPSVLVCRTSLHDAHIPM